MSGGPRRLSLALGQSARNLVRLANSKVHFNITKSPYALTWNNDQCIYTETDSQSA